MDADGGAVLARLSADRIILSVRHGWIRVTIPVFLLAFIGGAVADRFNRHKIVIANQTAAMILPFILSVLTLTHTVRVWHIVVLAALLGVVNAFDMPGRQAFIVQLVEKKDLMNAIALNSSIFNGARVLGPSIAGILIAGIGEGWCFFANGVSYIAVIVGLLLMKLGPSLPSAAAVRVFAICWRDSFTSAACAQSAHCSCCSRWSAWWECPTRF